jgi:hypothetical protein
MESTTLIFESSMYNHPFGFDLVVGWDIATSQLASILTIVDDKTIKIDPIS